MSVVLHPKFDALLSMFVMLSAYVHCCSKHGFFETQNHRNIYSVFICQKFAHVKVMRIDSWTLSILCETSHLLHIVCYKMKGRFMGFVLPFLVYIVLWIVVNRFNVCIVWLNETTENWLLSLMCRFCMLGESYVWIVSFVLHESQHATDRLHRIPFLWHYILSSYHLLSCTLHNTL